MDASTEDTSAKEARSEIRGSSLLLAGRFISKATNFGIQVLIVRALTRGTFGSFSYALSLVLMGQVLVAFGTDKALARFLPIYQEEGNTRRFYGTLLFCGAIPIVLTLLLVPGLLLAQPWLDGTLIRSHEAFTLFMILAFLIPIQAADQILLSLLAVFGAAKKIFMRRHVVTPVLKVTSIVTAIAAGCTIEGLCYAYIFATLLGMVVTAWLVYRVAGEEGISTAIHREPREFPVRELVAFIFPLLSSELILIVINTMDVVMLEQFRSTTAVGGLRAVQKIATLSHVVLVSFTSLYLPRASRSFSRNDTQALNDGYWQTALWVAVLTFPAFALGFACSEPIVFLAYGERYEDASVLLTILAGAYYIEALFGFSALTLKVYNRMRYVLFVNLTTGVFAFVANYILIPRHGATGAAVGTLLTLVLLFVLKQVGLWRLTNVSPFRLRYWKPYALIALFTGFLLGMNRLFHPPLWISIIVTGVLTALLILFSRDEMQIDDTFPELRKIPVLGSLLARRG